METNTAAPSRKRWRVHLAIAFVLGLATFAVLLLLTNIMERKEEAKRHVFKIVDLTEETIDPAEWGKNYPRQFDSYKRTVDTQRTRHGGSDAFQKLDEDPVWKVLFKGYAFGVDYREERGHAYMLSDQDMTERVKHFPQPGACLHCHSSVIPAYRKAGNGDVMAGFEKLCAMPYAEARTQVAHPVACIDCHDPESLQLRVTRPGFLNGIKVLAKSDTPLPHLPSVERWRRDGKKGEYEVNREASRQELRSLVCGQCHVEYYFKGEGKLLTYPWHNGLKIEQIEQYYDGVSHVDWKHATTGAPMLKAQHPEFELWSQGIHARSGVSCADCHMPYTREGAIKISDHHVRSPLLNIARACQTCHRYPESEILARAEAIQDRTRDLRRRAQAAVLDLVQAMERAHEDKRAKARPFHRKAQWRLDYVFAENSSGFHAPAEAARILAESIDEARKGMVSLTE